MIKFHFPAKETYLQKFVHAKLKLQSSFYLKRFPFKPCTKPNRLFIVILVKNIFSTGNSESVHILSARVLFGRYLGQFWQVVFNKNSASFIS